MSGDKFRETSSFSAVFAVAVFSAGGGGRGSTTYLPNPQITEPPPSPLPATCLNWTQNKATFWPHPLPRPEQNFFIQRCAHFKARSLRSFWTAPWNKIYFFSRACIRMGRDEKRTQQKTSKYFYSQRILMWHVKKYFGHAFIVNAGTGQHSDAGSIQVFFFGLWSELQNEKIQFNLLCPLFIE